ncbi:hypothetical protein Daura_27190 [Dactylosporangium aurantiacum]|uniref:Nitrogen fixation protein n=1 Tax=Dactylosporangium aurantiacum TaxID=35754 RepID=A0A9Q9MI00_9ACTN|nr:hypothetical protein [Dactylosporangium aurantiacum]MDG6106447.1 hypothetical protein [Dactylosporangium aurantiacum]UWZ50517.1 hypothetical protein Daura_27190 [Dactylosporangium aurantiacum]
MNATPPPARTCPSSSCTPGNLLLGIVRPDGTMAQLRPPLEVDETFVRRAQAGDRVPEARMRFAGPCVTSRCRQWTGERCGVADLIADRAAALPDPDAAGLAPCAIRATCRWWAQRGADACRICPAVVHTWRDDAAGRRPAPDDPVG